MAGCCHSHRRNKNCIHNTDSRHLNYDGLHSPEDEDQVEHRQHNCERQQCHVELIHFGVGSNRVLQAYSRTEFSVKPSSPVEPAPGAASENLA
jgi:hypothetical protein